MTYLVCLTNLTFPIETPWQTFFTLIFKTGAGTDTTTYFLLLTPPPPAHTIIEQIIELIRRKGWLAEGEE